MAKSETSPIGQHIMSRRKTVKGHVSYGIDLDDATVEALASGVCPEALARRAWEMLKWKREAKRNAARQTRKDAD